MSCVSSYRAFGDLNHLDSSIKESITSSNGETPILEQNRNTFENVTVNIDRNAIATLKAGLISIYRDSSMSSIFENDQSIEFENEIISILEYSLSEEDSLSFGDYYKNLLARVADRFPQTWNALNYNAIAIRSKEAETLSFMVKAGRSNSEDWNNFINYVSQYNNGQV